MIRYDGVIHNNEEINLSEYKVGYIKILETTGPKRQTLKRENGKYQKFKNNTTEHSSPKTSDDIRETIIL